MTNTANLAPETRIQHTDTLAWGTVVRMDGEDAIVLWDGLGLARCTDPENLRVSE
jgi:hypothetical protein